MKKPVIRFSHLRSLFFFQRLKASFHASEKQSPFISICVQKKIPVEVILTWTGQGSYSVMQRYIKVQDEYKKSEMNRAFK